MAASTSLTGCAQEAKSIEIILDQYKTTLQYNAAGNSYHASATRKGYKLLFADNVILAKCKNFFNMYWSVKNAAIAECPTCWLH